ncbi:CRISPR-associated protein [Vitreoscilla filiformis]|uniref:CRISPR-associated protein n=1 Tax=Vitreoscilla filiformis TaxID=63 RepID=A0A221KFU2_VITFI|nr:CRISPR-associated protein [Vitreoscilla filiformis]
MQKISKLAVPSMAKKPRHSAAHSISTEETPVTTPLNLPAQPPQRRHLVITRHPGAVQWVRHLLSPTAVESLPHLHTQDIDPNVSYYGVFPLNLAAAICAAGAECWALTLDMPPELRGQELSAEQLRALNATLVRYDVQRVGDPLKAGAN